MNALSTSALAVSLAVGASLLATSLFTPAPVVQGADTSSAQQLDALRSELDELGRRFLELQAAQDHTPRLRAAPDSGAARLAIGDIQAEVERLFEERWQQAVQEGLAMPSELAQDAAPKRTAQQFLELLLAGDLDQDASQALWDEAREAGQLDELIAMYEARAEEFSNDPDAQLELGNAYLQKIFEVGDGPAAGLWAGKADASYDRALALDDNHWEARSSKAIALSFWPPIFGKQKEAIQNFELLIAQQANSPLQDKYSQTYLLLGNMYHQTGQGDKANAIWQQGLGLFPDDASLMEQLGSGSGQ